MIVLHPWWRYSKKLIDHIERPIYAGVLSEASGMRRVIGRVEKTLALYWLVDETDGVIADASFQAFGPSALIGAADAASELVIRKNYDQASRISAELIDRQLRDKSDHEAFPQELGSYLNIVLVAIEEAASQCSDIPFAETYSAPPSGLDFSPTGGYPGWEALTKPEKITVIEEVINSEIRPYIELDAGGVQILDLVEGRELVIAYQGACTTCHSSTGATLSAIQGILQAKVSADLVVRPELSISP